MSEPFAAMFQAIRGAFARVYGPAPRPVRIVVVMDDGSKLQLAIHPGPITDETTLFIPNQLQGDILSALEGKALKGAALAKACGCAERTLYSKPHGIGELMEKGMVLNDPETGYYRPDASPSS